MSSDAPKIISGSAAAITKALDDRSPFSGGTPDAPEYVGPRSVVEDREREQLADDVMDMVQESLGGRGSAACVSADEAEAEKRLELEFLAALSTECNERLAGQGIRVKRVIDDGAGDGYVIDAFDRVGRHYRVELSFDEFMPKIRGLGQGQVRACIDDVCEKILRARARYFERMQ